MLKEAKKKRKKGYHLFTFLSLARIRYMFILIILHKRMYHEKICGSVSFVFLLPV